MRCRSAGSDTARREVHYPSEKETNGFRRRHGNRPVFCRRPHDKVLHGIKRNYREVKGEILLPIENRC